MSIKTTIWFQSLWAGERIALRSKKFQFNQLISTFSNFCFASVTINLLFIYVWIIIWKKIDW